MKSVQREALVPYSSQQMFSLVNDILAYPSFLPWCDDAIILSKTDEKIVATLHLAWLGLKKSFTTENKLEPNHKMTMQLVDGPFKSLHGIWSFKQIGDLGCKISIDLQFEFSAERLSFAFSKVFSHITETLMDSFIKQADRLYGQNHD